MAINLVPSSTADEEQQKMMQQIAGTRAKIGMPAPPNMMQAEKGPLGTFQDMMVQQVASDAVGAGTDAIYEKGGEMFSKLTTDPLTTPTVSPTAPVGGPLAPTTAPLPNTLATTVGKAPLDAASMMSQTVAPTAELAAGKMAEQAALGGVTGGATTGAATGAAGAAGGAGAMAGMAAAAPYVGAALAADEILGLGIRENVLGFNKGGEVTGPLSLKDALKKKLEKDYAFREGIYTHGVDGQTAMHVAKSSAQRDAIKALAKENPELMKRAMNYKSSGGPLYAAKGDKAEDEGMLSSIARKLKSAKDYVMGEDREGSKAESFLKGEGVSYKAEGGYLQGPLAIRKIRYKQDGGKIEIEATMGD